MLQLHLTARRRQGKGIVHDVLVKPEASSKTVGPSQTRFAQPAKPLSRADQRSFGAAACHKASRITRAANVEFKMNMAHAFVADEAPRETIDALDLLTAIYTRDSDDDMQARPAGAAGMHWPRHSRAAGPAGIPSTSNQPVKPNPAMQPCVLRAIAVPLTPAQFTKTKQRRCTSSRRQPSCGPSPPCRRRSPWTTTGRARC